MKQKFISMMASAIFVLTFVGAAQATVITFDEYVNNPSSGGEVNGTEWLSDGILFSTPDAQLNIGGTTGSSPNSLGANINTGTNDFSGSIYFEFINNNFVTDLSFTIFNTPFQASAYDLGGNLLNTIYSNSDFTQIFDFSGYMVHSVMVSGTFYAIDDVTYGNSNPVPEPSTIILLGSGLAGLAFWRRRKA